MPKCLYCKVEIKDTKACVIDASNPKRKKYYCNKEHEKLNEEKEKNKGKKAVDSEPPLISPRRKLTDYILYIYESHGYKKEKINWNLITAQLKNMMEENKDMKYSGMEYCLWYMNEVVKFNFFNDKANTVVSLLPFYYEESKSHCVKSIQIKKSMEEFNTNDVVVINKNVEKPQRWYNEIDITSL
jgi:hypothetical protein